MIAEVIVDVPARPVDRPFDYLIPTNTKKRSQSEVVCKFHLALVSIGLCDWNKRSSRSHIILKEISKVMDLTATLTEELVEIGLRMSEEYLCHPITAFRRWFPVF